MTINIDQLFVQWFGDFAGHAKMLFTFWILFVGGYWFVRIPPSKLKTAADYRSQTLARRIFGGMAAVFTVYVILIYNFG